MAHEALVTETNNSGGKSIEFNILTFSLQLSKPILTKLPRMAAFSPGSWHTNQANAGRTAGSLPRGDANNSLPRMGLSHWEGRVATVPGLKLVHRGPASERAHAIPPDLMIPCERANCVCTPDPAGERGGQGEATVGALTCAEQPHSGPTFLKGQITIN